VETKGDLVGSVLAVAGKMFIKCKTKTGAATEKQDKWLWMHLYSEEKRVRFAIRKSNSVKDT
jgi:hypothetical protein